MLEAANTTLATHATEIAAANTKIAALVTSIDLYDPPAAADFSTIINGGSLLPAPFVTDVSGLGMVFTSAPTQTSEYNGGCCKAILGNTWTITARLVLDIFPTAYRAAGLILTRS
jgi:hypothetical protein